MGLDKLVKGYTAEELADILEKAIKLKIVLYPSDSLDEIEYLVNREFKKFVENPEKYE